MIHLLRVPDDLKLIPYYKVCQLVEWVVVEHLVYITLIIMHFNLLVYKQ